MHFMYTFRACVYVFVCLSSLQYFDMIKDQNYDLLETYFYSYTYTFPTGDLLISKTIYTNYLWSVYSSANEICT